MSEYGTCEECNVDLEAYCFTEKQYDSYNLPTGYIKSAVSHLYCPRCGKEFCVDDTFDGDWYKG